MFFYDLMLSAIMCFFSAFVYNFVICYLKDKLYRELIFSLFLVLMTGLLLIYTNSLVSLVFLDIPILLGYLKNHDREAVILSVLLTLVMMTKTTINPLLLVSKYLIYFITVIIFQKKKINILDIFIGEKTFFLTVISFRYFNDNIVIMFLNLLAVSVFLYFLIIWITKLLNLRNKDYSLESIEREKSIFKITHEIKNPIAVCKGYLDMLDVRDTEKVSKYVPIVRSEINRTLSIMDDFMSLSNITIKNEILDIYLLIEDVKNTMRQFLDTKEVKLMIPKFNDELYILGDYDRLKQVFINIIKNSYEAKANEIIITTTLRSDQLKITVRDNGEGIDKKNLKRIGEMFYTTKTKGSGIGVNLSKEIITLHNGEIRYDSKEGERTTVSIFLGVEKGIN